MNRWIVIFSLMLLITAAGCSSGGGADMVAPSTTGGSLTGGVPVQSGQSNTYLWGYCDVYIDAESETIEAVMDRSAMFTCNVVNFLQSGPISFMDFEINNLISTVEYMDIDIGVTLKHPFPGLPQFNGYDVRGAFMGDGSATLECNNDLIYPVFGTDQYMFRDPASPLSECGAPDGYTRWFNISEFADPEMWLFGYTPGNFAPQAFAGTATLCPYKYFADGLSETDALTNWLENHPNNHGQFASGAVNTRNYYLRFPNTKGLVFGYAILASWKGVEPEYHPGNAPEAVACEVSNQSTVFYVDPDNNGGDLIFDVKLFASEYQPSTMFIESTVLSAMHEFTVDEMIPVGGGDNYSTYHVEIPADNVLSEDDNEYWVIARYDAFDYSNAYDILNDAWDDSMMACFRFDLPIGEYPRVNVYVDGDNDSGVEDGTEDHPYDTIMEAIDAAPVYSLVHVDAKEDSPGYYEEAVTLKTDCWLHGDNWNGGVGKPRIHVNSPGGFKITVPHVHGDDVSLIEFDNFELTTNEFEIEHWGGSGNGGFQLIRLGNCSDITIRNCRIGTTASLYYLFGIRIVGGSNITIEHNEIVNLHNTRNYNWSALTCGMVAIGVANCVIRQNEVHHINYQSLHNAGDARLTHTELISCFDCTPGLEVTNNLLYDAYDFSDGDGSNPSGGYFRHNYIFGIRVNNCTDGYIANNTMDDFNPVARAGNQAGKVRGILTGNDEQPADSLIIKNNIASNLVATELTSHEMFYGAGYYGAFSFIVDYSNVYNLNLTNGGAEYYNLAIKGTGSFDNVDMQDPQYGGPGPTFYHVGNPTLVSDDGSEMGAFGGPGGVWTPPSQE